MNPFGGGAFGGGLFGNMLGGMAAGGPGAGQVYSYSSSTVVRSGPDGTYHSSTTSRQAPGGVSGLSGLTPVWYTHASHAQKCFGNRT